VIAATAGSAPGVLLGPDLVHAFESGQLASDMMAGELHGVPPAEHTAPAPR